MPVARPRFASNSLAMAVDTTCAATIPKPSAQRPLKARTKIAALLVPATIRQPTPTKARPSASVARTPCRSTRRPAKGATAAMTSSAMAAEPEMKLRDHPSS